MNKRPKKYDTRDVIYDPSSGETNIRLTIPQEDIEKGLKGTQYIKHKWESIDIRLIYKNGRPNFAYIPQEPELDKMKAEIKNIAFDWQGTDGEHESFMVVDLNDVLQIIDKYKDEYDEERDEKMNKQEILNEIADLKERLNELEKIYDNLTPPNKRWRAKKGVSYYFSMSDGTIHRSADCETKTDYLRYITGNYFKTKEEAEFEVERRKVIEELKQWSTSADDFDWDNVNERKYNIILESGKVIKIIVGYKLGNQISDLCFISREMAINAINAVGEERIIKYYFRKQKESEEEK